MNTPRAMFVAAVLGAVAAPAAAQSSIGIRGYVAFGVTQLAAQESFEAVGDTSQRPIFGGGVQVTGIWKGIFADVGVSQMQLDGDRVFVDDGDVFDLNIPMEVKMRYVDLAAGWRLDGRFSPYVGGGVTLQTYEETSDFALPSEDVNESKSGGLFLGGVDVTLLTWIHAGGEIRYRHVTGIFREGVISSLADEFDERNAGGLSAAVRISIGR